jgi:hypothetical protein
MGFYDLAPPGNPKTGPLYAVRYRWPAYEWLHMLESAALGDYAQARDELRVLRAGQQAQGDRLGQQANNIERGTPLLLPGLLAGPLPIVPAFTALNLARLQEQQKRFEAEQRALRGQQADLAVMEGLLALEQGNVPDARSAFAEAQKTGTAVPFAGRPVAAGYLGKLSAY